MVSRLLIAALVAVSSATFAAAPEGTPVDAVSATVPALRPAPRSGGSAYAILAADGGSCAPVAEVQPCGAEAADASVVIEADRR